MEEKEKGKLWDAIILGGGGAGLFCAQTAANLGKFVLVLDHSESIGKKILISGGGRCNFTNIGARPECYHSNNPHFCKSALAGFSPDDFLTLVKKHSISFYEKKLGQLFCTNSAKDVVSLLLSECQTAGVEIQLSTTISHLEFQSESRIFLIQTNRGKYRARNIVVATGGLSIPKIGATDFGYKVARSFSHTVTPLHPALVGLTYDESLKNELSSLSGLSLEVEISIGKVKFMENLLLTHEGISGPSVLQISLYWKAGDAIQIKFLPQEKITAFLMQEKRMANKKELHNILAEKFPHRFLEKWFSLHKIESKPLNQISDQRLQEIAKLIQYWSISPKGTFGYGRAEVTRGGVDTNEIHSKTMESKLQPGLFFIGEVLDVTGRLGGYNFQWAWASGFAAGKAIGSKVSE